MFFVEVSNRDSRWLHVAEWLQIAAGITGVEVDSAKFDYSVMMCSGAAEYEARRSEILTTLVAKLAMFNFAWGSLEYVVKVIAPKDVSGHKGKINAACNYLKHEYEPAPFLPVYKDLLANFQHAISEIPAYNDMLAKLGLKSYIGFSGIGLHAVYKIRNEHAHGAFSFPHPDDSEKTISAYNALITTSSRLVLLSIQMLMLALYKEENFEMLYVLDKYDEAEYVEAHTFLRVVHIEPPEESEYQLPLLE